MRTEPDESWYTGNAVSYVSLEGCGDWARTCSFCGKEGHIFIWLARSTRDWIHGAKHDTACLNKQCDHYWQNVLKKLSLADSEWSQAASKVVWDIRAIETLENL